MTFDTILPWLFPAAVALHNLEEIVLLPRLLEREPEYRVPVSMGEFRFAAVVLAVAAFAVTGAASAEGSDGFWRWAYHGYAAGMLINVFIPHLAMTVVMRRPVPGVLTAVFCILPVTALVLRRAVVDYGRSPFWLALNGIVFTFVLVAVTFALFGVARTVRRLAGRE